MATPTPDRDRPTSRRQLLRFYVPLVLTSQLMTLSGPVLNVALCRAADPKLDLAGFWLGFTVLLFVESACLVTQQTTLALSGLPGSPRRLAQAALWVGVGASLMVLAIALTPLGDAVFRRLIPTTARVADLARSVLVPLALVPLLVSVRGWVTGLAIAAQRTSLVALAAVVRVLVLSGMVGFAVTIGPWSGAEAAAWAMICGITIETAFLFAATLPQWTPRLRERAEPSLHVSYRGLLRVAAPLAVATAIWTVTRPAVNAVLGRLPDTELAQASFGVILPILMASCSPLWALQEVSLVVPRSAADHRRALRFAAEIAACFTVAIGLFAFTPLGLLVLRLGFALTPELERVVVPALAFLVLEPPILSVRAVAQGLLMRAGRTGAFLILSPIKIVLMIVTGLVIVAVHPRVGGATLALLLLMGGDLFEALAYGWRARRLLARDPSDDGATARHGERGTPSAGRTPVARAPAAASGMEGVGA